MTGPIANYHPDIHGGPKPEQIGTPDPKPKRARKGKPKPPAAPKVERAKRATKARTLRVRIHDLAGDAGLDAFDLLRKKGGERYEADVRAALDARDRLATAKARNDAARLALAEAATALVDAEEFEADGRAVLDRLLLAAKRVASLDKDDVEPDAQPASDEPHIDEASFLKP